VSLDPPDSTSRRAESEPLRAEPEELEQVARGLLERRYAGFTLFHGRRDETDSGTRRAVD
jgi:hypothetical protein